MSKSNKYQRKGKPIKDADRRLRQADRLARVLRVLQLIQSRGRWTRQTIAEELECSKRTVERYLDVLEFAGVPYFTEKPGNYVRVRTDYRFPVLNLTEDELLGQSTAVAITQAPNLNINAGAKPASEKIAASDPETEALLTAATQLTRVLDLKLADHSKHREIIRTIQWGLLERRQVAGHYVSPYEPKPVKLTLHPYRFCLIKSAWYLIGQPVDGDQPQTYRAARFKSLRMLNEPAELPDDFDLKEYFGNAWAVYRGEQAYDIELLFMADAADIVTETQWHHTQKVKRHKDKTATLSFHVDGLNEIVRWLLGWAGRVKVIEPAELRGLVIDQHRQAIEANSL